MVKGGFCRFCSEREVKSDMKYEVLEVNSEMEESNRASVDEVKYTSMKNDPLTSLSTDLKLSFPSLYCTYSLEFWFVHQSKQQLQRASKGRDDMLWLIHRWPQHLRNSHERWEVISDTWCWLKKQGETRSWCGKQVTAVQVTLEVTNQRFKVHYAAVVKSRMAD